MSLLSVHFAGGGADLSIAAHGASKGLVAVGVADVEDGALFLTPNLTVVEAHTGSSASLDCTVARGGDHGMVSEDHQERCLYFPVSTQISWFLKRRTSPLVLLTVGDEVYIQNNRVALHRPVLSMVCCKNLILQGWIFLRGYKKLM